MKYCQQCGNKVGESAKFCPECGAATTNGMYGVEKMNANSVASCPCCGARITSLMVNCHSCGYELAKKEVSNAAKELSCKLVEAEKIEQKIMLIQSFPIPNNKDDIFEFMLLASTNFEAKEYYLGTGNKQEMAKAWFIKVEQSFEKAKLLCYDDPDFTKFENLYKKVCVQSNEVKQDATKQEKIKIAIDTIGLWLGNLLLVLAVCLDAFTYRNVTVLYVVGCIVQIAGAVAAGKKANKKINIIIGVSAGLISLLLGAVAKRFFYQNGTAMMVAGAATLIIIISQLVRYSSNKPKEN